MEIAGSTPAGNDSLFILSYNIVWFKLHHLQSVRDLSDLVHHFEADELKNHLQLLSLHLLQELIQILEKKEMINQYFMLTIRLKHLKW